MHIPSSTYRVQLHRDFTLDELKSVVDYLHELGISTIYAAPIGSATPGSTHGYDVTDPNRINPEVGDRKDMQDLRRILLEKGMTWLQDIVPNHMAFSTHNRKLMDVFERGPVSPYYNFFDINWNHPDPELNAKVMVPFLGKERDACIADGDLKLTLSADGIKLSYYDDHYPVSPRTIAFIAAELKDDEKLRNELLLLQNHFVRPATLDEWHRIREEQFKIFFRENSDRIESAITAINADKEKLSQVADLQFYCLTFWKQTEKKINYRRFFTVNSLICLRMEDDEVFDEYHRMISKMYNDKLIHGVRIDHIDGLNDPAKYLGRLRELLGDDCYIIAEKILESSELLPQEWPIQGTSGYEFLSATNKLFTDSKGSARLAAFYRTLVPEILRYGELVLTNKKLILQNHLAGEMDNLMHYFIELGLLNGFDAQRMEKALAMFMLSLPVYRVYPSELPLWGWELRLIEEAFHRARQLEGGYEEELSYLERFCTHGDEPGSNEKFLKFLKRLMQFTGPLTAKGVEDTTFYVYNPLISHDEVGDAPDVLGTSVRDFHEKMVQRAISNPLSLNATATHDTKRGEDARMRLNLLSEMPDEWIRHVRQWMEVNRRYKVVINDLEAPAVNDEYFIYQSIVGGFPENLKVDDDWLGRLKEYLVKALREGKMYSSWESPNEAYEEACGGFVDAILQSGSEFLDSFQPFIVNLINQANIHSVSQAVVKMTSPGIPDIYQGCELWDLSFVDPDNRRPVDYEKRIQLLRGLKEHADDFAGVSKMLEQYRETGILKLFAVWRTLGYRREQEELFNKGTYIPLVDLGEGSGVFGYARNHGRIWCLVVVPLGVTVKNVVKGVDLDRNFISLPASSPRQWRNIFTNKLINVSDERVSLHELLLDFPVAVLTGDDS